MAKDPFPGVILTSGPVGARINLFHFILNREVPLFRTEIFWPAGNIQNVGKAFSFRTRRPDAAQQIKQISREMHVEVSEMLQKLRINIWWNFEEGREEGRSQVAYCRMIDAVKIKSISVFLSYISDYV